jgi:hypothetical protein
LGFAFFLFNHIGGIVAFGLAGAESIVGWFGRNWMPRGLVIASTLAIAVKVAIMGAKKPGGKHGAA